MRPAPIDDLYQLIVGPSGCSCAVFWRLFAGWSASAFPLFPSREAECAPRREYRWDVKMGGSRREIMVKINGGDPTYTSCRLVALNYINFNTLTTFLKFLNKNRTRSICIIYSTQHTHTHTLSCADPGSDSLRLFHWLLSPPSTLPLLLGRWRWLRPSGPASRSWQPSDWVFPRWWGVHYRGQKKANS